MAINYDPSKHGGAAFGNADYEHLRSQGHSDSDINDYIGGLDNTQVSNKYKPQGGHTRTAAQEERYNASNSAPSPTPTTTPSPTPQQTAKSKAINYDPKSKGGEAFGNEDYSYLMSQGHGTDDIKNYIGGLDNTQVSNKYKNYGEHERSEGQQQRYDDRYIQTAAGFSAERGAYNNRSIESMNDYKAKNPTAGTSYMEGDNASFGEDGYLSYDSTKPQWQANDMLKDMGYGVGDMLWKPGALDNLNGRKLTGRIGNISENGIYSPELEYEAINSSHQSTGNPGYQGEVGLGADQFAYNRQYEQNNDVLPGQLEYAGSGYRSSGGSNPGSGTGGSNPGSGTGGSSNTGSSSTGSGVSYQNTSSGSGGTNINPNYLQSSGYGITPTSYSLNGPSGGTGQFPWSGQAPVSGGMPSQSGQPPQTGNGYEYQTPSSGQEAEGSFMDGFYQGFNSFDYNQQGTSNQNQSNNNNNSSSQFQGDAPQNVAQTASNTKFTPDMSNYGSEKFDYRAGTKPLGINFDFDPNRFYQGQ